MTCEQADVLLSGLLDGQLGAEEAAAVEAHVASCARCSRALEQLRRLEGMMKVFDLPRLPDEAWDEHWRHLYNRLERSAGYVLAGLGAILLLGWGAWELCKELLRDPRVPLVGRVGCALVACGLIVLTVSTVREKLLTARFDRYKEIKR